MVNKYTYPQFSVAISAQAYFNLTLETKPARAAYCLLVVEHETRIWPWMHRNRPTQQDYSETSSHGEQCRSKCLSHPLHYLNLCRRTNWSPVPPTSSFFRQSDLYFHPSAEEQTHLEIKREVSKDIAGRPTKLADFFLYCIHCCAAKAPSSGYSWLFFATLQ
jgi:hypothetical protein